MNTDKVYITKEVIDNIEHSEIDFLIRDEFGFDYENHSNFVEIEIGNPDVTNEPINIDLMIKTLQELKEKGSTHVSLDYHCDHIGYEMTGYKIYQSREEQVQKYENEKNKFREKQDKLNSLYDEIRKIQNEN